MDEINKLKYFKTFEINRLRLIKILIKKTIMILLVSSYFIINNKFLNQEFIMNNDIPKISIFLPIYNKAKYLKRSISSIQRQSIKDIEIIAVNDCSTDNSLDILNEMMRKDQRIKIINNKKNHGLLFSRAMGILNSKGEYLMFLIIKRIKSIFYSIFIG